ncbi:MAG TPA: TonB family protein [Candidatus Acidoferrales bacterium]|nr:TonB family protein [Candidatus Acidoferrales bacterium]
MSDRDGLGNLAQCMVDSDRSAKTRAKRLRRKALAASIALEALVLGAVILWPLVTLGVLEPQQTVTPLPPFRGAHETQPISHLPPHLRVDSVRRIPTTLYQPPRIPPRIESGGGPEPPGFDGPIGPATPGIVEGFADGQPIEIARPVPPPPPGKIAVRSGSVMEAMLVHRVQPEYPRLAKNIGLSGTVILRARIGTDGEVRDLQRVSGNALLAHAALAAVQQWRYRPTMLNGEAVEVETQITVNFVLN